MKGRERKNFLLFGVTITELYQASALPGDRGPRGALVAAGTHAASPQWTRSGTPSALERSHSRGRQLTVEAEQVLFPLPCAIHLHN